MKHSGTQKPPHPALLVSFFFPLFSTTKHSMYSSKCFLKAHCTASELLLRSIAPLEILIDSSCFDAGHRWVGETPGAGLLCTHIWVLNGIVLGVIQGCSSFIPSAAVLVKAAWDDAINKTHGSFHSLIASQHMWLTRFRELGFLPHLPES